MTSVSPPVGPGGGESPQKRSSEWPGMGCLVMTASDSMVADKSCRETAGFTRAPRGTVGGRVRVPPAAAGSLGGVGDQKRDFECRAEEIVAVAGAAFLPEQISVIG